VIDSVEESEAADPVSIDRFELTFQSLDVRTEIGAAPQSRIDVIHYLLIVLAVLARLDPPEERGCLCY
jgi:hypothetical protein